MKFDDNNEIVMDSDEVLGIIDKEDKVEFLFENGFEVDSDTEDVFRGIYGSDAFDESDVMLDALYCGGGEARHVFFLSNSKGDKETLFNDIGMVKRLINDNFWTTIVLFNQPLKNGRYAVIKNKNKKR